MKALYSILAVTALATYSALEITNTLNQPTYAAEKKTKTNNKSTKTETKLRKQFDQILVGDLMKNGEGGTNLEDIKSLLGKPQEVEQDDSEGILTETMTWTKKSTTITLSFVEEKVVSKTIHGYLYDRKNTIGLQEFDAIPDDISYDEAIKILGKPDGYSETLADDNHLLTAYWQTGIKRKNGDGTIVLIFEQGNLVIKTQNELK